MKWYICVVKAGYFSLFLMSIGFVWRLGTRNRRLLYIYVAAIRSTLEQLWKRCMELALMMADCCTHCCAWSNYYRGRVSTTFSSTLLVIARWWLRCRLTKKARNEDNAFDHTNGLSPEKKIFTSYFPWLTFSHEPTRHCDMGKKPIIVVVCEVLEELRYFNECK